MRPLSIAVIFTFTVAIVFTIAGCGSRQAVLHGPSKKSPATQKPYRVNGRTYYPVDSTHGFRESGKASWYGKKFHGRKTANGETFDMYARTGAHKTLPMNTMVLVRNLDNGRETVVRINDRGPFSRGRIIDLSYGAAKKIDMIRSGTARVEIVALGESVGTGTTRDRLKYQDFNTGNFYIQVGSFLDKNNAVNLARLLDDTGLKITIQPFRTNGKTYHRVQVYAGTSLQFAKQFELRIRNRGYPGSFIIAR
jgi:rare lipoprotein A